MPRSCPPLRSDEVGWHGHRVKTRLRLILERVFWFVNRGMSGVVEGDSRPGNDGEGESRFHVRDAEGAALDLTRVCLLGGHRRGEGVDAVTFGSVVGTR